MIQIHNMKKMICFLALVIVAAYGSLFAQTTSFNQGWSFVGLEFANQQKVDSLRKLGNKWEDQFLIQQVETKQDFDAVPEYKNLLHTLSTKKWQKVSLPHIAFPEPLVIVKPREGMAYYKKEFTIDKARKGKIITIEFEAVTQICNVWVNGKYVERFTGGYLPFEIDITHFVNYGGRNTILIEASNKAHPLVPPGKPVEKLDFIYYSGIYRDVWLHYKNPLHITNSVTADKVAGGGIFVSYSKVSNEQALVDVQTHIENASETDADFVLIQELKNKQGETVAEAKLSLSKLSAKADKHFAQQLVVKKPQLWHPNHPHLYQLHSKIVQEGKIVDEKITRIGIRSIEISRKMGLLINGEKFHMTGTNRHQNYPYIGNALSNNANYRDAWLIKNAGMNAIRTGHYPLDPSFMDAADELGLLVINCIPGWQFFNRNKSFLDHVMQDIRSTIRRDRNHPCVVLWEMSLNESYPPADFRCRQAETARQEWAGRTNFYTSGDSYYTKACWDVPYDDWDDQKGPGARNNVAYPDNAFVIREYGDYEFGGGESTSRQLRAAGQQGLLQQAWNLQWEYNKNLKNPYCIGEFTWAFYDGLAGVVVGIEGWGSADLFRIPKYSYYFFKSQQPALKNEALPSSFTGPMVFIANDWLAAASQNKVVVYSNCEEIALFKNNQLITRQRADNGPETEYGTALHQGGNPFDGGNANQLKHPPFTFNNIHFEQGTLKAVGYINGKEVATASVSTPRKATAIQLEIAENGKPLAHKTNDVVFVYAKIIDAGGRLIKNATHPVSLTIEGDATLSGPATVQAEAGIATFLIRTEITTSKLILKATASNLKGASKKVF